MGAIASGDNAARALELLRRLRADGVLPVRIVVGEVSLELVYPVRRPDGKAVGPGAPAAAPPMSLAEDYLGPAAAQELERTGPAPAAGGAEVDPDDEDVPAVTK